MFVCRDGSKRARRETDEEGCTPLLVAAKCGDGDTFSCLLEHISQLVVNLSFDVHVVYFIVRIMQVAGDEQDTENTSRLVEHHYRLRG